MNLFLISKVSIKTQNILKILEKGLINRGTAPSYLVSIVTETDIPTRRFLLILVSFVLFLFKSDMDSLTGILWTTLTQFPEEFCGGRIENSAPVAGLMLSTWAFHSLLGNESGVNNADWPTFMLVNLFLLN